MVGFLDSCGFFSLPQSPQSPSLIGVYDIGYLISLFDWDEFKYHLGKMCEHPIIGASFFTIETTFEEFDQWNNDRKTAVFGQWMVGVWETIPEWIWEIRSWANGATAEFLLKFYSAGSNLINLTGYLTCVSVVTYFFWMAMKIWFSAPAGRLSSQWAAATRKPQRVAKNAARCALHDRFQVGEGFQPIKHE